MKLFLILLLLLTFSVEAKSTKSIRWKIQNLSWENAHELSYQQFIHTLGLARKNGQCHTLDQCLRSSAANPTYYKMNPNNLKNIFSDCADLPYVLRAYFAWMNDLPFTYPSDLVEAKSLSRNLKDIRYSRYGNIITAKTYIQNGQNINRVLQDIVDTISTASFRTNASKYDSGELFRDTYPVDVDRKAIVPGTILYDPNGHVAVVYQVTASGKIQMIDAHPDNSLSAITYGEKFARSGVKIAAGFSNFRSFSVAGNSVTTKKNDNLPYYSLIQFQKGPFIFKGQEYSFYEYLRRKLADGDIIYNPLVEFSDMLTELCMDVKYREEAVNTSVTAGLQNQTHPEYLPENIYGADGDWEAYATPARDARLKTSVKEIKELLKKVIDGKRNKTVLIDYEGLDLVKDLRDIYQAKSSACTLKPTPKRTVNLEFVLKNLFALSFDPYHCAELRWGLTCQASENKMAWYKAEQGLRNRLDRDNTIKTNYNVKTLPDAPVSQVEKPDLDFDKLLEITRARFFGSVHQAAEYSY